MNIVINTVSGYGNWFALRFIEEGHDVDIHYHNHDRRYAMALDGICPEPSFVKPRYDIYDLSLFDLTGQQRLAEESAKATPTLGDGIFNSKIEEDRLYGIQIMEECEINVPFYEVFDNIEEAKKFVQKTKKRYVFKPNGGQDQDTASTYVSKDAEDMLRYFDKLSQMTKDVEFILQEVVAGTEISTEAWFNGEDFYLLNATLEEKKFMEGNKGPNTGCAGNLVWTYDDVNPPYIFREGLGKLKDFLQQEGYRGMIDLNTIVSDREIYGLEWTPRFGYDASATLFNLIRSDLADFMASIANGAVPQFDFNNYFAASVRLSIPPYPSEIKGKHPEGIPIEGIEEDDISKNCFLYDCLVDDRNSFVTAGLSGFVACPIYGGQSPQEAFGKVYSKIDEIQIPDVQWRSDVGQTTIRRYKILAEQGWLKP